jgi:pimeloyl-ACP methyl ester carboxylesterase
MKEIVITCSDGMQLAAKHWSVNEGKTSNEEIDHSSKIVCLHGWLDNAASFNMIAPTLNSRLNADILALDFPGHGHSGE